MEPSMQAAYAGLLNAFITLGVAWIVNVGRPTLRSRVPWLIPLLTPVLGIGLAWLQTKASGYLGLPIDLSPWLGAFTGASAVMLHTTYGRLVQEHVSSMRNGKSSRW